ncbi:MAG: LamG domain-containing protein [Planctomycetota bacterium]
MITDGILGGNSGSAMNSSYTLSLNQWYHIVGTYDGSTIALYVNGAPVNSNPKTLSIGNNNMPVCIGSRLSENSYKGIADDVRIYNRALTSEEVEELYENGQ